MGANEEKVVSALEWFTEALVIGALIVGVFGLVVMLVTGATGVR